MHFPSLYAILSAQNIITESELSDLRSLFHLYNIQYINDIILSTLELIYTILEFAVEIKGGNLSRD